MSHPFFSLPVEDRDAAYESARERFGVGDFYDLDPEQRAEVYDAAIRESYSPHE